MNRPCFRLATLLVLVTTLASCAAVERTQVTKYAVLNSIGETCAPTETRPRCEIIVAGRHCTGSSTP